jgi:lipopolysaccharide assembly protein A
MQTLSWVVRIVVVVLLIWFAAKNADPVTVRGYLDASVSAPLALILLAAFGGGLIVGLLASLMTIVNQKREIRKLNRALQQRAHQDIPSAPTPSHDGNG